MARRSITFSAGFCIMLALAILLIPVSWLVSVLAAAIVHELCHHLAIRFMTGSWASTRLLFHSARIAIPDLSAGNEAFCALAGPAGGMMLACLWEYFPKLAICGLMQSIYNMIPVYPMDGGRVVRILLSLFCTPPVVRAIMNCIAILFRIVCLLVGVYFWWFLKLGFLPMLFSVLICIRVK